MSCGHVAQLDLGAFCLRVNASILHGGFTRVSVPTSIAGTIHFIVFSDMTDVVACFLFNLLKYEGANGDRKRSMRVGNRANKLELWNTLVQALRD